MTASEGLPPDPVGRDEADAVRGPAQLAYYTPVRSHPPFADRKAASLLAAAGLLVSVLLFFSRPLGEHVRSDNNTTAFTTLMLLAPLVGLLLICGWYSVAALTLPIPPMPHSLAYFPDIGSVSYEEYRRAMLALSHRQALRDMLHYNYSLAVLAAQRFRLVERGTSAFRGAFVLWAVLMVRLAFP